MFQKTSFVINPNIQGVLLEKWDNRDIINHVKCTKLKETKS